MIPGGSESNFTDKVSTFLLLSLALRYSVTMWPGSGAEQVIVVLLRAHFIGQADGGSVVEHERC